MPHDKSHLTEEEFLLALDGELSPRRADDAYAHLADCQACRARMVEFKSAADDFDRAYRRAGDGPFRSSQRSRALLEARMAALSGVRGRPAWLRHFGGGSRAARWAYVVGLVALGAIAYGTLHSNRRLADSNAVGLSRPDPVVPDASLTPGRVRRVTASEVCQAHEWTETQPPVSIQQAVFHEYGMDGAQTQGYELDHLITPALGGTDDIQNLWPESYSLTWNAHVKDELEDRLRVLVCSGQLDLTTAQRDIATNWVSAYKKYFHTEKPLSHNSGLSDRRRTPPS